MNNILKLSCQLFLIYPDDIVIFSKSYEDHLIHSKQVLMTLSGRNFVLNPSKCELPVLKINYLGYTINEKIITS